MGFRIAGLAGDGSFTGKSGNLRVLGEAKRGRPK
jgi:hypothetical protein